MRAYELRISDWSSDVCSSDLHDDDLVIAQLVDREFVADAGAERLDQRSHLLRRDDAVEARALDVQYLALQRQDRLDVAVAALLGAAACGIALDQEQLAFSRIAFLTVGELAGQADWKSGV